MKKSIVIILLSGISLFSCNHENKTDSGVEPSGRDPVSLKPDSLHQVKISRLNSGDLRAVIVDNSAYDPAHRSGYNGISELYHTLQDSNVFVPFYAGFNLEHIFGGDSLIQLFEPRLHPMALYRISDREVLLYQGPTPLSNVESRTRFKLQEPHYIDITFRFIIHDKAFFRHGYAGFFWASYINRPADRSIYFRGFERGGNDPGWIKAYSGEHGIKSTHTWKNDTVPVYFADNFNARLASHFSDYQYDEPFFYGRFHNMVLAFFFDRAEGIRFSQSPTGGGEFNPAWDFQFIVPGFETGKEYSFRARMVYKPWEGREEIIDEYDRWASRQP